MKVTLQWLKELVDVTASIDEICAGLTSAGLEVASVESRTIPDGVIVAQVMEIQKHPNADKLRLVTVDMGNSQRLTVVCGAPNVVVGMKVPLATEGSVLAPGFTVKETAIRGVKSKGMLCSERELGISNNHEGLMNLPVEFVNGMPINQAICDDMIIEIELTPNRGDCLSVVGIAREIAARFSKPLKPAAKRPVESNDTIDKFITVSIEDAARCPRYMGRLVRNVTIKESPLWLKRRLAALGLRPINNVVDVTNYILLLYGQPMHSFDYDAINGKKIIVKRAVEGQKFATLDDVERNLTAEDLLICDGNGAVALAGIMGGGNSGIKNETKNVFLECAFFDPVGIRRTSKRLDLSTDSSYRFERGVDPEAGLQDALDTAAAMIADLAGGTVVGGIIDIYPKPFSKKQIQLRLSRVARILGEPIPKETIIKHLTSLRFILDNESGDSMTFTVPHYRHDLIIEADLIEEVGRMYGYDTIKPRTYAQVDLSRKTAPTEKILNTIRYSLAAMGLHETITYSMISEKKCALLTPERAPVVVLNPINPDLSRMRTTLAGSLLDVTAYNLNRKNSNNGFFEVGRIFSKRDNEKLPREQDVLAILLEGSFLPAGWNNSAQDLNFFIVKSIVESLRTSLGLSLLTWEPVREKGPSYYTAEKAAIRGQNIYGYAGRISPDTLKSFDIKTPVYYVELDITELLAAGTDLPQYSALPRYPAVERDFCFVMEEQLLASAISNEILRISDLVEKVEPFDVYRGEKLNSGYKSIAYSVKLRSDERTLTDSEAEEVCTRIVGTMKEKFGAVLRVC